MSKVKHDIDVGKFELIFKEKKVHDKANVGYGMNLVCEGKSI